MSGKVDKAIEEFQQLIASRPLGAFLCLPRALLPKSRTVRRGKASIFRKGSSWIRTIAPACSISVSSPNGRAIPRRRKPCSSRHSAANPDYSDALLELANLRITSKKYAEAAELLRRYVKVSHNPATGYYKLAMVERNLHETAAADRDLSVFQTLSKNCILRAISLRASVRLPR